MLTVWFLCLARTSANLEDLNVFFLRATEKKAFGAVCTEQAEGKTLANGVLLDSSDMLPLTSEFPIGKGSSQFHDVARQEECKCQ